MNIKDATLDHHQTLKKHGILVPKDQRFGEPPVFSPAQMVSFTIDTGKIHFRGRIRPPNGSTKGNDDVSCERIVFNARPENLHSILTQAGLTEE